MKIYPYIFIYVAEISSNQDLKIAMLGSNQTVTIFISRLSEPFIMNYKIFGLQTLVPQTLSAKNESVISDCPTFVTANQPPT